MIEAADIDAARRKALRLIFQRGFEFGRRLVPFGLVIEFDDVAVRIAAAERRTVAEIAIGPADVNPDPLRAATRRSSACGLRARNAMCSIPEVFEAVSLSE